MSTGPLRGEARCCSLHSSDPSVSFHHAEIEEDGHHVYVTDLRSSNGTYVNGCRIPPKQRVLAYPGCSVQTGAVIWVICHRADKVPLVASCVEELYRRGLLLHGNARNAENGLMSPIRL